MLSNSPARRRLLLLRPSLIVALFSLGACTTLPTLHAPPGSDYSRLIKPNASIPLPDGEHVPARIWASATPPRAVILSLHGFNDSRDAWEEPAPLFTADGITVVAPDARGFGATAARGHWVGTASMVTDARAEALWTQRAYPGVPLYVMGESMGGAIALLLAAQPDAPPVAGTILLSPAVWSFGVGSRAFVGLMAAAAPGWSFSGNELPVKIHPSDNREALLRLYYDPLSLRETRLEALNGLLMLMHAAADAAPHVRGPTLVLYGGQDDLVPKQAMHALWTKLPTDARRDYIPGGHHLLMRDLNGATATRDVLSWIDHPEAPLPSGGDVAAAAWYAGWATGSPALWVPGRIDTLVAPRAADD